MNAPPVSEGDLQAWLDGRLAGERRRQVERWLADNPAAASRLRAYDELGAALRERYAPILAEPLPEALRRRAERPPLRPATPAGRRWPLPVAAIALSAAALGWFGRGLWPEAAAPPAAALARQAALAHRVYSADAHRPVELGGDQEAQLRRWLSQRLGTAVRVPQLAGLSYELLGGRVLPGSLGPAAQLMYQDAGGRRLTLYVSAETAERGSSGFQFVREGDVEVCYWQAGPFGYALSAAVARAELAALARAVVDQLAAQ